MVAILTSEAYYKIFHHSKIMYKMIMIKTFFLISKDEQEFWL